MSFTKNLKFKRFKILFLKFVILRSLIETSLKQFILDFSNRNVLILGAFLLPVAFYLNFLQNSNYKKVLSLIEQNLPGTLVGSNSVSWETFQKTNYLPISNGISKQLIDRTQVAKSALLNKQIFQHSISSIDYWGEFLTLEFTNKWKSYNHQYFLGLKTNSNRPLIFSARDDINSPFYSCLLPKSKTIQQDSQNKFQRNYYQLDEFPFKLQNIFEKGHQFNLNILTKSFPNEIHENLDQNKKIIQSQYLIPTKHFLPTANTNNRFVGIQNWDAINTSETPNLLPRSGTQTFKDILGFQTRFKSLEKQLKNVFYQTGYIFPKTILTENISGTVLGPKLLGTKFAPIASNQILNLIDEYNNSKHFLSGTSSNRGKNPFLVTRQMSGFKSPDMGTREFMEFNRQNNYCSTFPTFAFFTNNQVSDRMKVYLGSHFNYPIEYLDKKPSLPSLKLKYYPAKFEGLDGNVHYSGPVVLPSQNPTEFNYQAYNWFKVRNKFQSFFNPNDPRQLNQSRFFGGSFFDMRGSKTLNESEFQRVQTTKFYNQLLKRKDLSGEREFFQLPNLRSEYVVPYLTSLEWNKWLLKNVNSDSELNKTPYIQSFPIRQISFIKNENIGSLFDPVDYQNPTKGLNELVQLSHPKVHFHEWPFVQSSVSSDFTRRNYANITYLKRINQYKFVIDETSRSREQANISNLYNSVQLDWFSKRQTWEPLHSNSWLVVTQYGFAVFVLYVLRQFALSYGRELVSYLIDLFSSLGIFDASFKDELISEDSRYRIINRPKTRFQNIAGIEQIFSQLSEVVWFLRNSKRFLDDGQKLPKGILLVGPPGTGKTLLVQAIAGEAQIPIFLQPAGAFNNAESLGAQRLQQLFEKAKQLSPCIIFFDEIDSIGQRRSHIIQNPAGSDSLFSIVSNSTNAESQTMAHAIPFTSKHLSTHEQLNENTNLDNSASSNSQSQQSPDQLSLLMQLLIELDGLQSTKKVIVIGATNRVDVLDPALIRPGRFDKILQLGLPKKFKRIQICQLYAQILGTDSKIYWEYIGNKTFGLSGADLATIMNQSSIDAILNGTKHTMQTIEVAINKIIGDSTESHLTEQLAPVIGNKHLNSQNPSQNNFPSPVTQSIISRLGYYQAGTTVMKLLLPQFQTPISCALLPKHENARYKKVSNDFLTAQFQISRRQELKAQVIALYSGKLCEFLYFRKNLYAPNSHFFHSDFASEDLSKATNLIYQMVDKWYLYSHTFLTEKLLNFSNNQNQIEILDSKTDQFLSSVSENVDIQAAPIELMKYYNFQNWAGKSWWQIQVTKEESATNSLYANWYRIYLKNPDETIDNDEWAVPDKYYHTNETYFLTKTTHFNDFNWNKRDSLYQTLLRNVLDETFCLFGNSTEFIDFFVTFLIKNQYLRRFEIDYLYNHFYKI